MLNIWKLDLGVYMHSLTKSIIQNYKDIELELTRAINTYNHKVILLVGIPYTLFEFIGLTLSYLGFFQTNIRHFVWAIVIFHLIYLTLLIVDQRKNVFKFPIIRKIYHNIYGLVLIFWGTSFTLLQYSGNEDITIFSIVIILISSLFWYTPHFIIPVNSLMFLYLSLGVSRILDNQLLINAVVYKGLIVTGLASIIAFSRFFQKQKMHYLESDLKGKNDYLTELSFRDSLTKLYNNGYMFERITQEIECSVVHNSPLFIMMLDLDNFKSVNDNHGHLIGDRILIDVADILINSQEIPSIPGRYGGEEFIIILPNCNEHQALSYAETIRKTISNLHYEENISVTASIGLANFDDETTKEFVKRADINLYRAKSLGKNQVVFQK